jgi:hypothetical protein
VTEIERYNLEISDVDRYMGEAADDADADVDEAKEASQANN